MNNIPIYIEFSPEIQINIVENKIKITDHLIINNQDLQTEYRTKPYEEENGARGKDLVLTIFASSALILSVGMAISKVLRAVYRKPFLIEYYDVIEAVDNNGKTLKDKKGNPIIRTVKRYELLEPRPDLDKANAEFSWSVSKGVVIKYGSVNDQK